MIGTIKYIPEDVVELFDQIDMLFAETGVAPLGRYQHVDLMISRHHADQMNDNIGKPPGRHNGQVEYYPLPFLRHCILFK